MFTDFGTIGIGGLEECELNGNWWLAVADFSATEPPAFHALCDVSSRHSPSKKDYVVWGISATQIIWIYIRWCNYGLRAMGLLWVVRLTATNQFIESICSKKVGNIPGWLPVFRYIELKRLKTSRRKSFTTLLGVVIWHMPYSRLHCTDESSGNWHQELSCNRFDTSWLGTWLPVD